MAGAKSWKTTLCGLIAAVASYAVANPATFARWPWVAPVAGILMASGIAGVGIASKDSSVHSTESQVIQASAPAVHDPKGDDLDR